MCWPNYESKNSCSNCIFSFEFKLSYQVKSNFATSKSPFGSLWIWSETIFLFSFVVKAILYVYLKNKTILLFLLKEEKGLSVLILLGAHKFSHPISHYIATSPRLGPLQHKSISWIKSSPTLVLCFWDLNQIRKALVIHLLIRTKSFGCWVLEKWKHWIYSWLDNRISYFNDKFE